MGNGTLAKAYDPSQVEAKWYPRWLEAGVFAPVARPQNGSDNDTPYVILLPPPNVTGVLHMGHILSSTIQDVFIRWHRMCGRETLWWPGSDHAGIATQKVVEKALADEGIDFRSLGRDGFVERCWQWKERSHRHIVQQMQRVGWSLDWPREYFTLDEHMSRAVAEVFVRLYDKGLVYRDEFITNWCPVCRTALSDEEVEHVPLQGKLWTVQYERVDGGGFVEVATTRPETILGDVAVAIHPDDERAPSLVGTRVRLPVVGREIPVIADEYVDPEFGTGMVKITPAHDPNDFEVGRRHGLDMPVVMDVEGRMNEHAGPFAGLDRMEARKKLLQHLDEQGRITRIEKHELSQGRHDRCGTVIEPYLSKQWFVRMQPLAGPAVRVVEEGRVRFYPERWKNVYLHWMNNIQDWCISRQLWWGHRIPIFYCQSCDATIAAHGMPERCSSCEGTSFVQEEDVLDTWFSSWLCPISPMGWPEQTGDLQRYHPSTMLVTGPDIIFFWVARMVMASLEFQGDIPFDTVLLNGILRDAKGRKMSKSLGNSPDPIDLMDKYGADALRFSTVMLSPPGQDTFFDEKNVETGRNFANKIWNATRLVLSSAEERGWVQALGLHGESAAEPPTPVTDQADFAALWHDAFGRAPVDGVLEGLRLEDRWILTRFQDAVASVDQAMQALRVNEAAQGLYHFFWDEFCAWYLESIKPRFYGDDRASSATAHAVALVLLAQSCKLLSPFMPFLAEELWSMLPGTTGFVMTAAFPRLREALRDSQAERDFSTVMETAGAIRTLRAEMNVPPGKRAQAFVHSETGRVAFWEGEPGELLRLFAKLERLEPLPASGRPEGSASVVVGDQTLLIPLGDLIDLDAERTRLDRELEKLGKELARVEAKLNNSGFTEKAPEHIVEHERGKRADLVSRQERIQHSLTELSRKSG
jgi:valyl-tRNA synthetase